MKVRKNAEAVFLAAAFMATFAAYATAHVPVTSAAKPAVVGTQATANTMQVVVIKAKRLSAAEKAVLN